MQWCSSWSMRNYLMSSQGINTANPGNVALSLVIQGKLKEVNFFLPPSVGRRAYFPCQPWPPEHRYLRFPLLPVLWSRSSGKLIWNKNTKGFKTFVKLKFWFCEIYNIFLITLTAIITFLTTLYNVQYSIKYAIFLQLKSFWWFAESWKLQL